MKTPAAKPPLILSDMTQPQFHKFHTDWNVFKHITNLPKNQIHPQLYNTCDETVQNRLVNTVSDFFSLSENELLDTLEAIVTKKSNPAVHRLTFASLFQSEGEPVNDFVIWLKFVSPNSEFTCHGCNKDLEPFHIKDQLICGLYDETLQTDILAKASHLTKLEDVIKHAEAYESAQHDQSTLQKSNESTTARTSICQKHKHQQLSNNPKLLE